MVAPIGFQCVSLEKFRHPGFYLDLSQFHFSSFELMVFDLNTGKQVGTGGLAGAATFSGRHLTATNLNVDFFYRGTNTSDTTWLDFYNACAHIYPTTTRPTLSLTVAIQMKIRGVIGTKGSSASLTSINCPIELPSDNA